MNRKANLKVRKRFYLTVQLQLIAISLELNDNTKLDADASSDFGKKFFLSGADLVAQTGRNYMVQWSRQFSFMQYNLQRPWAE